MRIKKRAYEFCLKLSQNAPPDPFLHRGGQLLLLYTATGQKAAKLVYQTGKPVQRTDYLGAYQYEQDSLRFSLKNYLDNLRLAYRVPGWPVTYTATLEQWPYSKATR